MIAAKCLTADLRIVSAVLNKLTSAEAKRAVVQAIVSHKLSGTSDLQLFEAIVTVAGSERLLRHKFAHWLWGSSPDVPTKLVLANPTILLQHMDEAHERLAEVVAAVSAGEEAHIEPMPSIDRDGLYVLSKNGARIGLRNAKRCQKWLTDFHSVLVHAEIEPARADRVRSQLRSEDPIRDALSRMTKQDTS